MTLDDLIEGFRKRRRLPIQPPDARGRYRFSVNGRFLVSCFKIKNDLVLKAKLSAMLKEEGAKLSTLKQLLKANLGRQKSHSDSLAYDADDSAVVLYARVSMSSITPWRFDELMREFINALTYWSRMQDDPDRLPPHATRLQ